MVRNSFKVRFEDKHSKHERITALLDEPFKSWLGSAYILRTISATTTKGNDMY